MGTILIEDYLKKELYQLIKKDDTFFDFIQEGSLDGIWYRDLETFEDVYLSPRFWEILGYDPKHNKHKSAEWQEIIFKDDLNQLNGMFEKHLQDPNYIFDQIIRYRHKNGSTVWMRCRGIAIRDVNGKAIRMVGVHTDITNLKQKEAALIEMENEKRTSELIIANKKLAFQIEENEKLAAELIFANKELALQNKAKEKRAAELIIANNELAFQNKAKEKRAAELIIANKELAFQNKAKEKRAAELIIANKELAFQSEEKEKRAAELIIANKELAIQNKAKEKRAAELNIANKELAVQNRAKEKRAAELIIANKELAFQSEEKEKRAAELNIANKELAVQNKAKEKRAAELIIANKELAVQSEEKEKRAAELIIANKELAYQNKEKKKRAAELIIANRKITIENEKNEYLGQHDYLTNLYNRRYLVNAFNSKGYFSYGLMMIDINGLKLINDAYGHVRGDEAIRRIANLLMSVFEKDDIVARIGGDEFAILAPHKSDMQLQDYKDKLILLSQDIKIEKIPVSLAIGYEILNENDKDIDELLSKAEKQLYRHKITVGGSIRNHAIQAILSTLTEKYKEEKMHSERVSQLCKEIGTELGLSKEEVDVLELAGMYHDIGKISIPDAILNKPDKLTDEEYEIIKTHTQIGYQILRAADEYSGLAEYALSHHERWDGRGYPKGLKGEEIPLFSRIINVADSFEAMTADRPYRKGMSIVDAGLEIKNCSGRQFDPGISNLFLTKILQRVQ